MEERQEGALERAEQMVLFIAAERRARLALRQGQLEKVLTALQLNMVIRQMTQMWMDGFVVGAAHRARGGQP
ncbi:hypothetical protein ACFWAT_15870 [Streptomyces syringium]|uniref:hypothetical protein n=1 Tax=Streptomyces syringium TaxID=76729 RepID=UPI00365B27ED